MIDDVYIYMPNRPLYFYQKDIIGRVYHHGLTGAFYVGWLDGLLEVAGMITMMKWIIPENTLRLAPVSG